MSSSPRNLYSLATDFENFCGIKLAFIRKLPNGKWVVVSRKGKNLGTFDTKSEAETRLNQVEYFKHKKAKNNHSTEEITYSSVLRFLNKVKPEIINEFQKLYKDKFDELYLSGESNPEDEALDFALNNFDSLEKLEKTAAYENELGNPQDVGKYIAGLIRFLTRKTSLNNKQKVLNSIRQKIYFLNEYVMQKKSVKGGASIGQAINITKNILNGHNPNYIRQVLNAIVRNLNA